MDLSTNRGPNSNYFTIQKCMSTKIGIKSILQEKLIEQIRFKIKCFVNLVPDCEIIEMESTVRGGRRCTPFQSFLFPNFVVLLLRTYFRRTCDIHPYLHTQMLNEHYANKILERLVYAEASFIFNNRYISYYLFIFDRIHVRIVFMSDT